MKILVAEDETIIRLDLRALLEGAGFEVCAEAKDGETFAGAAARELLEETGLEADVEPLESPFEYEGVRVESFIVDAPQGWEPTLDWEHDEYRWLPREEAAELLYWPEPAALLRSLP